MTSFDRLRDPRVEEIRQVGETYLDYGPTLSESYGRTLVRLLVRDPENIFAYWEGGSVLNVTDLTTGRTRSFNVTGLGAYYVPAEPGHEYEAEVGSARSNRVRTPRRGPALEVDAAWPLTPAQEEEIRRLADLTGVQFERPTYGSARHG